MNLVLLGHPDFIGSQSQSRFAAMLADAFQRRGHRVAQRQPQARWRRRIGGRLAKWTGYVDQYLVFPRELREQCAADPPETLYVFCDQALGPWMPMLAHRPHVVHCHDLLALRSALGLVPENPTAWSGRLYQRYIRHGFRRARHFISISQRSRDDLHRFGGVTPAISEVVYNGLNHPYRRVSAAHADAVLARAGLGVPLAGLLLHVGGGQWYKNTAGVLHLYARFAQQRHAAGFATPALWLVSPPPGPALLRLIHALPAHAAVRVLQRVDNQTLEALYTRALALLFPSLAEGFGWPIAEALACGCPVLTTGEAPMNEVGGEHAVYLPRLAAPHDIEAWAERGALELGALLQRAPARREADAAAAVAWASRRYCADAAIDGYLAVYERVLARS